MRNFILIYLTFVSNIFAGIQIGQGGAQSVADQIKQWNQEFQEKDREDLFDKEPDNQNQINPNDELTQQEIDDAFHEDQGNQQPDDSDLDSTQGSGGDDDNDVPTLLAINSSISSLQSSINSQFNQTRSTTSLYSPNSENSGSKEITLADLYNVIVETSKNDSSEIDSKSEEKDDQTEQFEDDSEEQKETFLSDTTSFVSGIQNITEKGATKLDTNFDLDIGSYNFYLDPFNDTFTGGISLDVTWQDIADWISLIVGLYCVFRYWKRSLELVDKMMQLIFLTPISAPVSNLSIFGNSIGTLKLMIIKFTLFTSVIVSVVIASIAVIYESNFSIAGISGTFGTFFDGIMSAIVGSSTWSSFAVSLLFDCIPIISITGMIATYWIQRLTITAGIFFGINVIKATT